MTDNPRVVLPDPDSPTTPTISPRSRARSTPRSTTPEAVATLSPSISRSDAGSALGLDPGALPVERRVRGQRGDVADALAPRRTCGVTSMTGHARDLVDEPLLDVEQGGIALRRRRASARSPTKAASIVSSQKCEMLRMSMVPQTKFVEM